MIKKLTVTTIIFFASTSIVSAQSFTEYTKSMFYLDWLMDEVTSFILLIGILLLLLFISIKNGVNIIELLGGKPTDEEFRQDMKTPTVNGIPGLGDPSTKGTVLAPGNEGMMG